MIHSDSNRCADIFLEATDYVLFQVMDEVGTRGETVLVSQPVSLMEVAVILGVTGDQEGRVLFELSHETALKIVQVMNFGEVFTELDDMARATLAELGNLVAGRAVTIFNDAGGNLQISPPMLMCGIGMRSSDLNPVTRMSVKLSVGEVVVNLSVRPKSSSGTRYKGAHNGAAVHS